MFGLFGKLLALGARIYPDTVLHPHRWIARAVVIPTGWLAFWVVGVAIAIRVIGVRHVGPWEDVLGALACTEVVVAAGILTLLWPPGRQSLPKGSLRVAPWRCLAFPASVAVPIALLPFYLDHREGGHTNPLAILALPVVLMAFGGIGLCRERLAWSDRSVTRVGLLGPRQEVQWQQVSWIYARSAGARIGTGAGDWVAIPGFMLEGWPEFAATLLERVPPAAFEASPGAREALELAAFRYTGP